MAKKERFITPELILVWPKLNEPDVYQPVDKKGKPNGAQKIRYITRAKVIDQVKFGAMQKYLEAKLEELGGGKNDIFKKDKKTGDLLIEGTSGVKYRPPAFDAKNKKLDPAIEIGGGTKAKLDLTINYYDGFGGGLNFYINAIQVLDLVEGGQKGSNFEETDGYEAEGSADESSFGKSDDEKPEPSTDKPYSF